MGRKKLDLVGHVFTRLTVLSEAEPNKWGNTRWRCLCACGNEKTAEMSSLRQGLVKSCGCLHKENEKNLVHLPANPNSWRRRKTRAQIERERCIGIVLGMESLAGPIVHDIIREISNPTIPTPYGLAKTIGESK